MATQELNDTPLARGETAEEHNPPVITPDNAAEAATTANHDNNEDQNRVAPPINPSFMVNPYWRAWRENPTQHEVARRVAAGVSANYRGNYNLEINRPANIPEDQNCSVFITSLPADITVHRLLVAIRDIGRVWATVINPPTLQRSTAELECTWTSGMLSRTATRADLVFDAGAPADWSPIPVISL